MVGWMWHVANVACSYESWCVVVLHGQTPFRTRGKGLGCDLEHLVAQRS